MEYYTEEEMVQFRKPRKKKKVRKRLKADDLIPLADERTSRDHASRYMFVYVSTRVVGHHALPITLLPGLGCLLGTCRIQI